MLLSTQIGFTCNILPGVFTCRVGCVDVERSGDCSLLLGHYFSVLFSCVFSDLGSQEGERETSEKEVESQGPQPQPAVITSIINHQVQCTQQ